MFRRFLNGIAYTASRYLGPIYHFRETAVPGRFLYVQKVPGHREDTVTLAFQHNRLIRLEGATKIMGATHRFHRLVQMPLRADTQTLRIQVNDGLLMLTIQRPA